jgi:hypothetical protein
MRFWILAAIALMLVAAPDSAQSQNSAVKGPARTVALALAGPPVTDVYGPPGGNVTVSSAGFLPGNFATAFPDNLNFRFHNLACRTGWYTAGLDLEAAAAEFYSLYLIIGGGDPIRVQIFNTKCPVGGGPGFTGTGSFSNLAFLGADSFEVGDELVGLFTEDITFEVWIEDLGGPTRIVLSGTDLAPN